MKAVLFTQAHVLKLIERSIPQPETGQVLLRVDVAGICMTDLHIFHGDFTIQPPRVLGHEIAGTVVELGPDVAQTWMHQQVGVQPAHFCGACSACLRDRPELCVNFQCLGNTQDGGYAEYTLVAADQLVALGEIPTESGVWLEPLACVLHALSRIPLEQEPVLIAGAGIFGKLFTQVLTRKHQLQVGIVDPNQARLDQAISMGAAQTWQIPRQGPTPDVDAEIMDWSDGGPGLLIDTSGQAESIERLLRWAGPAATILLFGVSAPDVRMSVSPAALFAQELHLTASAGMTPAAFDAAFQLLAEGKLSFEPLISAHVTLETVPDLMRQMPPGKVIINPHRSDV